MVWNKTIPARAIIPFAIDCPGFKTMAARIEPIAIVEAKSKLDIFAKVRSPEILVIIIITVKIAKMVSNTFNKRSNEGYSQFSIIYL